MVHGWRARVESFDVACFAAWFASSSTKSNKPLLPDSLGLRCSFLRAAPRRPYLFAFWEVRGCTTCILGMGTQPRFWFKHNVTTTGGTEEALENTDSCQRNKGSPAGLDSSCHQGDEAMKSINTALPPPPPHGFHSLLSPCSPFPHLPQTLSPIRQDGVSGTTFVQR